MRAKSLIEPISKRLVFIHEEVMDLIWSHRQSGEMDCESGGVLIGKRRGEHLEVTTASSPQVQDIRSRYKFTRHQNGHQNIVENCWRASDGEDNYIGEWHTHPEIFATPSSIDIREWKKLFHRQKVPLVVIIGGLESSYFGLLTGSTILRLTESG